MIVALLSLLVSYIPCVLLFVYLRNLRKEDTDYRKNCTRLLRNGILCAFAVILLAFAVNLAWKLTGFAKSSPLLKVAFEEFIMAALIEEFVKYKTAGKVIKKNKNGITWLDCIAFTAIVGIGFQVIESIVYVFETNVIQILVRGFTMGHPAYGMLMGYFTGKALYTKKRSYNALAFGLPFLIHGMYDFSLADEFQALNDNLVFVPFIIIFIELTILIRMLFLIKKERRLEKFTTAIQ